MLMCNFSICFLEFWKVWCASVFIPGSSVEDSDPKQSLVFGEMSVELEEVQNFLHKMQHLKKDPKKYQSLENLKKAIVSVKEEQANLQPLNRQERSWRTSEDEFAKRKQRVNFVCSAKNVSGNVMRVLPHDSGVLYCIVPKAGCTFWKRLFAAVQSQVGWNYFLRLKYRSIV